MKAIELNLGDLFDLEGWISLMLTIPVLFFVFYLWVYPVMARNHYDEMSKQFTSTLSFTDLPAVSDCGYRDVFKKDGSSAGGIIMQLPEKNIPVDDFDQKPSLIIYVRSPKFFSSYIDTNLSIQIENHFSQTQRGRLILYNKVVEVDGGGVLNSLNSPAIQKEVGGTAQNYIDFEIPACTNREYSILLHPSQASQKARLLLWFGYYLCSQGSACTENPTVQFIPFSDQATCNDVPITNQAESSSGLQGIAPACIPADSEDAFQHSAREKLLLSPWSNAFLPIMALVVIAVLDRVTPGRDPKRNKRAMLRRTLAVLALSLALFGIFGLMIVTYDVLLSVRYLWFFVVGCIVLLNIRQLTQILGKGVHGLAVYVYTAIFYVREMVLCRKPSGAGENKGNGNVFSQFWRSIGDGCREAVVTTNSNADPNVGKPGVGTTEKGTTENGKTGNGPKEDKKTIFLVRKEKLCEYEAAIECLEKMFLGDGVTSTEALVSCITNLNKVEQEVKKTLQPGQHQLHPSEQQLRQFANSRARINMVCSEKLLPKLLDQVFNMEQRKNLSRALYGLQPENPLLTHLITVYFVDFINESTTKDVVGNDARHNKMVTTDPVAQAASSGSSVDAVGAAQTEPAKPVQEQE